MEAATRERALAGDKAIRIVEAMRASVAQRGVAGSTFDHVAREAGVSRGLLHYYFGTKERLLAEVVRRDCDVRLARLEEQLATASSAHDFVALLRGSLVQMLEEDPEFLAFLFELFTLARRNPEVSAEFAELLRRTRDHVAAVLAAKQDEGVLALGVEPDVVADLIFSVADGIALRMLGEPDRDYRATIAAAEAMVEGLLDAR